MEWLLEKSLVTQKRCGCYRQCLYLDDPIVQKIHTCNGDFGTHRNRS
ncbi:MAG: hypothetical protein QXR27_00055 [Archaeoglobaceae archaeon]